LWWPRGYGEAALYDAKVEVYSEAELLDTAAVKVGIRSVKLIQEPDEEGKSFIFQINGQNVFCKGANWIPADSFLPKVNYQQYNKLLTYAAEANFNMLRVWGGGVYEADEFYDLCDALGIMVWQDFMYVCAGYPEEEWFLREAEREAMEAILRLRGHPASLSGAAITKINGYITCSGGNETKWSVSTAQPSMSHYCQEYAKASIPQDLIAPAHRLEAKTPRVDMRGIGITGKSGAKASTTRLLSG
jgi:hypothetical protein